MNISDGKDDSLALFRHIKLIWAQSACRSQNAVFDNFPAQIAETVLYYDFAKIMILAR